MRTEIKIHIFYWLFYSCKIFIEYEWHSCMVAWWVGIIALKSVYFSMHDDMLSWHSCMLRELELVGIKYFEIIPRMLLRESVAIYFSYIWLCGILIIKLITLKLIIHTTYYIWLCIVVKYLLNISTIIEWKIIFHTWLHVVVGLFPCLVACWGEPYPIHNYMLIWHGCMLR